MMKSPPRLVLGAEPPSDEGLMTECDAIISIAAADELEPHLPEEVPPACGVCSLEEELQRIQRAAHEQQEDDEDFNFDFLDEPDHPLVEWSDSEEEEEEPVLAPKVAPPKGAAKQSAAKLARAQDVIVPSGGSKLSAGMKKELAHTESADQGHSDFVCDCPLAKARSQRSCLKQFTGEQLSQFHAEAFGVYVGKEKTKADVGPRAMGVRIHRLMWPLREEINEDGSPDDEGRSCRIRTWRLGTKVVCRKAWERAYGAADSRYRAVYHIVQRGHGPEYEESAGQV